MNTETVKPLFDDFLRVVILVAIGLNNSFMPGWLRACSLPLMLIVLAAWIFVEWKREHLSQEEQRDMERAETDERNLMLREKAAWLWTSVEYWLMLGAFWVLGVALHRFEIAYTAYWILVIRWFGLIVTRWWLNRKY